jgi:hypothetical protein
MHAGALSKGALAAALTAQADSVDEATCAAQEAAEQDGTHHENGGNGSNNDSAGSKKNGKKNGSSGGGDSGNGLRNCYLVALPEDHDGAASDEEAGGEVATWAPTMSSGAPASVLLPVLHHPAFSLKLLRNCFFNPAPVKAIKSKS